MSRRLGLPLGQGQSQRRESVSLFQRRKLRITGPSIVLSLVLRFLPSVLVLINGSPPLVLHHPAPGSKQFPAHRHLNTGLLILAGRIEHRQEPAHHQIVDPSLIHGHVIQLHELLRGDNGVVIRHLGIVDKKRLFRKGTIRKTACQNLVGAYGAGRQPLLNGWKNVRTQVAGIRSGIGEYLVILVQPLHDI